MTAPREMPKLSDDGCLLRLTAPCSFSREVRWSPSKGQAKVVRKGDVVMFLRCVHCLSIFDGTADMPGYFVPVTRLEFLHNDEKLKVTWIGLPKHEQLMEAARFLHKIFKKVG